MRRAVFAIVAVVLLLLSALALSPGAYGQTIPPFTPYPTPLTPPPTPPWNGCGPGCIPPTRTPAPEPTHTPEPGLGEAQPGNPWQTANFNLFMPGRIVSP